jgi:hypothetical protein
MLYFNLRYWDKELWSFLFLVLLNCAFTDNNFEDNIDIEMRSQNRKAPSHQPQLSRRGELKQPVVGALLEEVSTKLADYLSLSGGSNMSAVQRQKQVSHAERYMYVALYYMYNIN